jgi:protein NrfC
MAESMEANDGKKSILRRDFLFGSGAAIAAGVLAVPASVAGTLTQTATRTYAASTGYLVYDSRLCLGCQSCMYACSMAHEGMGSPSLSRIQIIKDAPSFTEYPYDIAVAVCRQCVTPLCVQNCPTGACHVDEAHGHVRMIDQAKCIGCQRCLAACPQRPHRPVWNPAKHKSAKCDLCADAPFWSQSGGPTGHQACIETCAVKALKLVKEPPSQEDIAGYDVNLVPTPALETLAPKPAVK